MEKKECAALGGIGVVVNQMAKLALKKIKLANKKIVVVHLKEAQKFLWS